MARHQSGKGKQVRQHVALEAARIMADEHLSDFAKAKKKAADRLGITTRNDMPTNQEIEQELIAYRSIFSGPETEESLQRLRNAALDAMTFFERFNPRLVGPVLEGSANAHAQIQLHLFAEIPDDVVFFLMEKGIDYDQAQRTVKYKSGKTQTVPAIEFDAGEQAFSLLVFPAVDIRQAPQSPVNGLPMQRADIKKLKTLLDQSSFG
jgi:hypothetical protein